jgi:hypothetical protein
MIPFTPVDDANKVTRMVTLSRHPNPTRDSFLVPWPLELSVHVAACLEDVA